MKTKERTTSENVDEKVAARRSGKVARKVDGDLRAPSVREAGERARRSPSTSETKSGTMAGSAPVWIGVGIVFALLAMAWTALFFYASKHRAVDVPLEHASQPQLRKRQVPASLETADSAGNRADGAKEGGR